MMVHGIDIEGSKTHLPVRTSLAFKVLTVGANNWNRISLCSRIQE